MKARKALFFFVAVFTTGGVRPNVTGDYLQALRDLKYRVYPRRSNEEAAVIEWGHSAIISALDASVAHFGPQTNQAALLEVDLMPVLASPVNGDFQSEPKIRPLDNLKEVRGNMAVMTNTGDLSGVEMAKIAQASGAAALLVVNYNEERPDDIYRLPMEDGAEEVEIPVVMISLNSANVLSTASVTPEMRPSDVVNNGMPERIRLYAGGDRPYFEDVESTKPTIYIIHNLLTLDECSSLIKQAKPKVKPVDRNDRLQLTPDFQKFHNVDRVLLWQGMLQTQEKKQIDERIEQVTGFPSSHFSDFLVDRLTKGSHWKPQYDNLSNSGDIPVATITIFLTDVAGGAELVYPSTAGQPVKIIPRKGMAVVHHNVDENHDFDVSTVHSILPVSDGEVFIARRFVFTSPVSTARRVILPFAAVPFGGRLPILIVQLHDFLNDRFGDQTGPIYFDKACLYIPILVVVIVVSLVGDIVRRQTRPRKTKSD